MSFGVYVHIPYCLQRCVYCDFATYEFSQILPPDKYISILCEEIKMKAPHIGPRHLDTVYFGGGTPSLLDPQLLLSVLDQLRNSGFTLSQDTEVTLEINPATMDPAKIEASLKMGFNRFSLGAQTFRDDLLKLSHRKHSALDTIETLKIFNSLKINYSADILFALPKQSLGDLEHDLDTLLKYHPQHISPYCLTVPESNPMAKNRPLDDEQVKMFELIERTLATHGYARYEISNFALPGFESKHNLLYWNDNEYWGVGLSSHSYMKWGAWGTRFWNPRQIEYYTKGLQLNWETSGLFEKLQKHEALTDFVHTSLRKTSGLDKSGFIKKFGAPIEEFAKNEISKLINKRWLDDSGQHLALTPQGLLVSNQVFSELTFLDTP